MPLLDDLDEMFDDTLVVQPVVLDEYGSFVASGASLNLDCYIDAKPRLIRDDKGNEVVSSAKVIVQGFNNLNVHGFRYTIPSRYSPNADIRALAVHKYNDEDGPHHEEVMLP